jgi:tetratricopeptide (TPR) repeat protein
VTALVLSFALLLGQSDEARAKALFKEGETAYNLGQFDTALVKYSDAYKLKALPGFLFNIAQCHRQLQQYERAAFFYGRYLDTAGPKGPQVEVAKGLLEEMRQKQAATPPVEEKKPPPADDLKKPPEDKSLADEKAREELKQAQLTPLEQPPAALVPLAPTPVVVAEEPVYQKGWFWGVVVGAVVVVAGGATAVAIVASPKPKTPSLGPDLR